MKQYIHTHTSLESLSVLQIFLAISRLINIQKFSHDFRIREITCTENKMNFF